jgi:hypothetical protein
MKAAVAAVILLVAALHLLGARRLSVGVLNDDAANVLLARSISAGHYELPGKPRTVEGFLPAFPALLAAPAALAAPHWELLRLVTLFFATLAFWLTWRLARKYLPPPAAAAATLFTALNPVIIGHSGLIVPYIPFLALTLALLEAVDRPLNRRFWYMFTAGAALAPLLRPHGVVLVTALSLALRTRVGTKKSAVFFLCAMTPIAAWSAYSRLTSTAFDYPGVWLEHAGSLFTPAAIFHTITEIVLKMLGRGFFMAPFLPEIAEWALGIATLGLAFVGARILLAKKGAAPLALVLYSSGFFVLHLTWPWVGNRYVIPIVPFLWILILAAVSPRLKKMPVAAWIAGGILTFLPLSVDSIFAAQGYERDARFEPRTMAWLHANVPPSARLESVRDYTVALLTEHPCYPQYIVPHAGQWLEHARRDGVDYLHLQLPLPGDAFPVATINPAYQPAFARWLLSRPEATEVFRDEEEGALVFRINR